jgi:hypothetical protein
VKTSPPGVWDRAGSPVRRTVPIALLLFLAPPAQAVAGRTETLSETLELGPQKDLWVEVHSDVGEVTVRPSRRDRSGDALVVFDEKKLRADLDFDPEMGELFIDLDRRSWFRSLDTDEDEARIEIEVPRGAELHLDVEMGAGEMDLDLASLAIPDLRVKLKAGECAVDLGEERRDRGDRMELSVKVGELTVEGLGSRSFREARISCGIGELEIDFSGEDGYDGRVEISQKIGEIRLTLPQDPGVGLEVSGAGFLSDVDLPGNLMESGDRYVSENYDRASRHLELEVSAGIGEVSVSWAR